MCELKRCVLSVSYGFFLFVPIMAIWFLDFFNLDNDHSRFKTIEEWQCDREAWTNRIRDQFFLTQSSRFRKVKRRC
jgi:hypothetical protein